MKRILVLVLIFNSIIQVSYARQWILFHSEEGSIGHVFATFIQEDETGYPQPVATLGFNTSGLESVPHDIGYTFYVEVNETEWKQSIVVVKQWENKSLWLPIKQDCVTFIKALIENLSSVNKPGLLFIMPADYIQELKRLNPEINSNSQNSISNSIVLGQEKKALKDAAINFYKWDEQTWETSATAMKLQSFKMILNKQGKPEEDDGYGCPCTIEWKEVDKFFAWVKSINSCLGNDFVIYSVIAMKQAEATMKNAKTTQENLETVENFYIDGMFHIFPGNAGAPKFSQSGIYTSGAIWDIDINSDNTAYINTTFEMPAGWSDKVKAYRLKMVKENNTWKLAEPVKEGKISILFGK